MKNKTKYSLHKIFGLSAFLLFSMLFSSCVDDIFLPNGDLLIGRWVKGTEYWVYEASHTGKTWDTSDDVNEDEAQRFTWELNGAQLIQYHQMESSSTIIPKSYKIVALSDSVLEYEDDYGNTLTFNRL